MLFVICNGSVCNIWLVLCDILIVFVYLLLLCILYFYDLFHIPLSHWLNSGSSECIVICVHLGVFFFVCMYVCMYTLIIYVFRHVYIPVEHQSFHESVHTYETTVLPLIWSSWEWSRVNVVDPFQFSSKLEESNTFCLKTYTHFYLHVEFSVDISDYLPK